MKKLFLMAAMMVATLAANAQVYVGGGINFSSSKPAYVKVDGVSEPDATTKFGILPEVGYKLDDKLSVGIALGYTHSSEGDVKTNGFSIAPYARYTFVKWNNIGLFGEAQFAYHNDKTTTKENIVDEDGDTHTMDVDQKKNGWSLGVRPGISIDLNEKLTFITKFGWLGYKSEKPSDAKGQKASSDFGFDVDATNLQFSLLFNL